MKKKYKKIYTSLQSILNDPKARVVVRHGTAYEQLARELVPDFKIVTIRSYADYTTHYPDDVLLRGEFQQISWTLTHPEYTIVFPDPGIAKDAFGYAVAQGSDKFLTYLNLWLDLKKTEDLSDQQYNVWILGQTDISTAPTPRWSILHNVFGID